MKVVVLASGSDGNSTFISSGNHKILIDLGRNAKYIKEHLNEINENASDIEAIIISHTHKDHTSALKVFLNQFHPKVYLTEKQYYDLDFLKDYDNVVIYDEEFFIGDIKVSSIHTSHDVTDSRNFIITIGEEKIVSLTDTGYLNHKYFKALTNCDYYLFESNHDVEMLLNGSYPTWLKQRIVGTLGHLSNKDSSFYLSKLIGDNTKKVILMHLSKENNTEQKALETLFETFKEYEIDFKNVLCAKADEVTGVCDDKSIVRG